jgi:hypothetical protein
VIDQIDLKVVRPPEEVHIEGGDVMLGMTIYLLVLIKEVIIKIILQRTNKEEYNL